MVKAVEVWKINNAELHTGNVVRFEVVGDAGMKDRSWRHGQGLAKLKARQ